MSLYKGIELDLSERQNMQDGKWIDKIGELQWGILKTEYPEAYHHAGNLLSLLYLHDQVCKGGIEQYFKNGYHKGSKPKDEYDLKLGDMTQQKKEFQGLVSFAKEIYPERVSDNAALSSAANAFQWIMCHDDEYFEATGFDDAFYQTSDYFEELLNARAQFYCKLLVRDLEKNEEEHADLLEAVRTVLPELAFGQVSTEMQNQTLSEGMSNADATIPLNGRLGITLEVSPKELETLYGDDWEAAKNLLVRLVSSNCCQMSGDTYFPVEWNEEIFNRFNKELGFSLPTQPLHEGRSSFVAKGNGNKKPSIEEMIETAHGTVSKDGSTYSQKVEGPGL